MHNQQPENMKEALNYHRQWLQQNGLHMKIRHDRLYVKPMIKNQKLFRKTRYMTKADCKYAVDANNCPIYEGYQLQNNGGMTTVSIFKDDKFLADGVAQVHPNDNFMRIKGILIALKEAKQKIKKFQEMDRQEFHRQLMDA